MNTIIMLLWCFILNAVPFRKVIFGALYVVILGASIHFTYNYTTELVEDGIMLVSGE